MPYWMPCVIFLRDFSSEFQEDLSSKPTLQELGYALNLAFKVNVDSDVVSGFDELEVKEDLIKTAKRKKDKRSCQETSSPTSWMIAAMDSVALLSRCRLAQSLKYSIISQASLYLIMVLKKSG